MTLAVCLLVMAAALAGSIVLLVVTGRRDRVLSPVIFFVGTEVAAVWPPLMPGSRSAVIGNDGGPLVLAATAMLTFVVAYVLMGGARANQARWRGFRPDERQLSNLSRGLVLLVLILVSVSVYRFGSVPPLLRGGFSALLDPAGNADQVALIRENRKLLTKGAQLLNQAYAGQGALNAFAELGWRIALVVAALVWRWTRTTWSLVQFIGTSVLAFIFLASAGARLPLILAAIAVVAAITLTARPKVQSMVAISVVSIGLVLLIMPLSKGVSGGESIPERVEATYTRVTEGNGRNNAEIVNLINDGRLPLQHGGVFLQRTEAMLPGVSSSTPFAFTLTRLAYGTNTNTTGSPTYDPVRPPVRRRRTARRPVRLPALGLRGRRLLAVGDAGEVGPRRRHRR